MSYAAGVLLYSKRNGEILFLLGKDDHQKWSDFGGKDEIEDRKQPYRTASRECYEETNGIIHNLFSLRERIETSADYVVGRSYMNKPYYMYLVQIPFSHNIPNDYSIILSCFKNLEHFRTEKKRLRWFKFSDVLADKAGCIRCVFLDTLNRNISSIKEILR